MSAASNQSVYFPKGPSIKDVHRDGGGGFGQMRKHADKGEGVKDRANVRKLVLLFIVSACFANTLYG